MLRTGKNKDMIYRYLRKFWRHGATKNGLLPDFANCGAKGQLRIPGTKKRGRPNNTRRSLGIQDGINIGPDEQEKIRRGIKRFYHNPKLNQRFTLKEAYERTLEAFFRISYNVVNGTLIPVLPPPNELPSFRQFEYVFYKDRDLASSLIARKGQRRFNLRNRSVIGDSSKTVFGPGCVYQIDATTADIYLVSSLDRNRIIGRPTLYFLVDVFSRLITGFNVTTENPSYIAAALAIENAALDKVEFCEHYGITISREDWPSQHLPECIVADRGELEGPKADILINGLNIKLDNTPPYRADLKGLVERNFRTVNENVIHWLPGHVKKDRERGDRDYRLDAVLDLQQFTKLIIHFILDYNRSWLNNYRLDEFMMADQLEPRPNLLWEWGIINRIGHLRQMDPDLLRMNLLPSAKATVTSKGIRFQKVYYACERAINEQWFVRARSSGTWQVDIAYDPRTVDFIYLRPEGNTPAEACKLVDPDQRFHGSAWVDLEEQVQVQKMQKEIAATSDRQSKTEFRATVDTIVSSAAEQTKTVQTGQSKRARVGGIRANRKLEREHERRLDVASEPFKEEESINNVTQIESEIEEDEHYTAPPSHLDLLEQEFDEQMEKS